MFSLKARGVLGLLFVGQAAQGYQWSSTEGQPGAFFGANPDFESVFIDCPVYGNFANSFQPPTDEENQLICAEYKEDPACAGNSAAQFILAPLCDFERTLINCPVFGNYAERSQTQIETVMDSEENQRICAEFKEEPACAGDSLAQSILAPLCGGGYDTTYGSPYDYAPAPTTPPTSRCTEDLKQCPGGSYVARVEYKNCDFETCPEEASALNPYITCGLGCPDYYIGDTMCDPECNTPACRFDGGDCDGPVVCSADDKLCSDGSYVARDEFNACKFTPCPSDYTPATTPPTPGTTTSGYTAPAELPTSAPATTGYTAPAELPTSAPATTDNEFSICNGLKKRKCKNLDGCQYSSNKCGPDPCDGFNERKCNKKSWCVYSNNLCEAGEVEAPSPCDGLRKKKCRKTDGCEYTDKCDEM